VTSERRGATVQENNGSKDMSLLTKPTRQGSRRPCCTVENNNDDKGNDSAVVLQSPPVTADEWCNPFSRGARSCDSLEAATLSISIVLSRADETVALQQKGRTAAHKQMEMVSGLILGVM